ncbi:MAG: hypothetical protein R6U95_00430 [Bacteroidales bacterium]
MAQNKKILYTSYFNFVLICLVGISVIIYLQLDKHTSPKHPANSQYTIIENLYGAHIKTEAGKYNLPENYFKALILLETSARKNIPHRFEPHVYKELLKVKKGLRKNYEYVTQKTLINMSDNAIRNLASSWGPFQIMGYKCIQLGIYVADLRGKQAIKWGIAWINENYGHLLRQKRFKDAFHMHNTGRIFPKNGISLTHNSQYVENGLYYMKQF